MTNLIRTYNFFAGGGFVDFGLPNEFHTIFANDFDEKKVKAHKRNLPHTLISDADINKLTTDHLPEMAEFIWASPPCQDLSLAGKRGGLDGKKSSAFFPFFYLVQQLVRQNRAPKVIVLENVADLLNSNGGADLALIQKMFLDIGYQSKPLLLDARWFVPQSRERIFIVFWPLQVEHDFDSISTPVKNGAFKITGRSSMFTNYGTRVFDHDSWNDADCKLEWLDHVAPKAPLTTGELFEVGEFASRCNRPEIIQVLGQGQHVVGFRRTRTKTETDEEGNDTTFKTSLFELNATGPLGCLRTYSGGSSIPSLITRFGDQIRVQKMPAGVALTAMGFRNGRYGTSRTLTSGKPDNYILPENFTDAYNIMGDAVVPQCVTYLCTEIVLPLMSQIKWVNHKALTDLKLKAFSEGIPWD